MWTVADTRNWFLLSTVIPSTISAGTCSKWFTLPSLKIGWIFLVLFQVTHNQRLITQDSIIVHKREESTIKIPVCWNVNTILMACVQFFICRLFSSLRPFRIYKNPVEWVFKNDNEHHGTFLPLPPSLSLSLSFSILQFICPTLKSTQITMKLSSPSPLALSPPSLSLSFSILQFICPTLKSNLPFPPSSLSFLSLLTVK